MIFAGHSLSQDAKKGGVFWAPPIAEDLWADLYSSAELDSEVAGWD